MADHAELIGEMPLVEKMTTQDRLKHARKRRLQQLKRWQQREKEINRQNNDYYNPGVTANAGGNNNNNNNNKKRRESVPAVQKNGYHHHHHHHHHRTRKHDYKVHFVPSVMLLEAAARGDVEEVRRLLMLGVNPDSTNEDGLTALHQCCIDNNEDMMRLLLEFGANVNAEDSERWTPLHAAATCGHLNLVKYLISKGGSLLAVNADGNMPYDICEDETTLDYIESEMSKRGVTQELIDDTRATTEREMLTDLQWLADNNGDFEYRDQQGATPLHIAAANGYTSVVEFLLDHNVATDACDADYWQPIHAAACWGHAEVLELLVHNAADLNALTKNGETPYDICEDLELKERILQLKNEMEIKRTAGLQSQRLRRSQSQNSRNRFGCSRRTSIRDKNHMSRQEALEEAKMRQAHLEQGDSDPLLLVQDNGHDKNSPVLDVDSIDFSVDDPIERQPKVQVVPPYRITDPDSIAEINGKNALTNGTNHRNGDLIKQNGDINRNSPLNSPTRDVKVDVSIHLTLNTVPNSPSNSPQVHEPKRKDKPNLKTPENDVKMNGYTAYTKSQSRELILDSLKLAKPVNLESANLDDSLEVSEFANHKRYQQTPETRKTKLTSPEVIGPPQKHGCCVLM